MAEQRIIAPVSREGLLTVDMEASLPSAGLSRVSMATNRPGLTLGKWGGAVALGVGAAGLAGSEGATVGQDQKVRWASEPDMPSLVAYPLMRGTGMHDGGFEIELVLPARPGTNVFHFPLTGWENLAWAFQTPLTARQRADGHSRPAELDGSFAVFHKTLRNHRIGGVNFGPGKVFHIPRPTIRDSGGHSVLGDLSFDRGTLSVTVPQGFLDQAVYPVTIDPTFGYTTQGVSSLANDDFFTEAVLTEDGTLTEINFWAAATSGTVNIKGLLYTDVANAVTNVVAVGAVVNCNTTPAARASAASVGLTAGNYYAGAVGEANFTLYYDGLGTGNNHYGGNVSYASPGNSPSGFNSTDAVFSGWATYTAGGGGGDTNVTLIGGDLFNGRMLFGGRLIQ